MVNYANFTQDNNSTFPGSHVIYQGKPAIVKMGASWSENLTIEVDGKIITVNKNDLFGINEKKEAQNAWFEDRVAEKKETIAKNDEKIELLNKVWNGAVAMVRSSKESMYSLLKKNNVSHYSELKGEEQEKYLKHMHDRKDARSAQLSSAADVIRLAHQSGDLAFEIGDLLNQQALFV